MNSEKVKEIKKALEFQRDGLMFLENNCAEIVYCKDILTLINELEKENGELKQHITEVEKGIINIAREKNKKEELASKFIDSYNDSLKQFADWLSKRSNNQIYLKLVEEFLSKETGE